ncbi:hypothetical protein [Streptomyces rubradiris]|uniref:Tip attachment protein J domain-containing protein n=1 Tax=Streptomyces rubradiris TaxID=285531 RepID=A0ABQ3R3L7_STRRR|nr:hypothetical protein [Streptomyces rubradiris]GHH30284.1 hypothetical protein GCM10018792_76590 [Streptomyces rubradiris]GHI50440.1 hypothetical protein Srubr_02860 [Streptomyces rubradiris]
MPGSIAAQVMAWQRRMGGVAGPLSAAPSASGEADNGTPVQVEMLVSGTWVDITSYTMVRDNSGQIAITRGIRDEGSQTEAGTCALELKNQDGRFSPRTPSGPYYGLIGRNTPIRISVPDGNGGKSYRIWSEASEWAPSWDTTGTDVWTDLSAGGILRRLAQGPAPERSVIYQAVTSPLPSSVVAYWPCEDASGATQLASALTSGSAMTWTGTPTLASYSGFAASDPLPDLTSASLSGGIPKYDDPAATQVRFLAYIPAAGLSLGKVLVAIDQLEYSAGSSQFWEVYYDTATRSLTIRTCASDGTVLGAELQHTLDVRGRLLYVSVELQESGANISRTLRLKDVNTGQVYSVSDTVFVTQLTRVVKIQFGPASRAVSGAAGTSNLPGVAVGHVTVENAITPIDALGVRLNPIGETAGRRIQRLCDEAGLAYEWNGDLDDTVPMGAQPKANLLSLVQECVLADGGLLYELTGTLGLGYRTRASLYNQDPALVLDYPSGQLAQIPTPVEDDRYIQNKVTVTVGGVSETYEETSGTLSTALPPAGVGAYGGEITLNLASTDAGTLQDQAAWRVHLGTVDEARFPQVSVNLAHPSITPTMRRAILGIRLGDRIEITNPPSWLPPDTIDQLVLGISETITHFEHKLTFTCAPASPYSSIGFLDATEARVDTDGSELAANISSSAAAIAVQPSAGADVLWTKDLSDFPLDIRVGGEVMRVTSISDLVTDTYTRTVAGSWGTNDSGFTWTLSGGSASDYSVGSGVGAHLLATAGVPRRCLLPTVAADFDFYVSVTADQLATGAALTGALVARYTDDSNLYSAQVQATTANAVTLLLFKRVSGTETILGSYTLPGTTFVAGVFYRIRFKLQGSLLRAKAWAHGGVEPPEWHVTAVDTELTSGPWVGVRSLAVSGNTNVTASVQYENFQIVSPQMFTLTRSINGVVKSHSAGEDVRLAHPTILAL